MYRSVVMNTFRKRGAHLDALGGFPGISSDIDRSNPAASRNETTHKNHEQKTKKTINRLEPTAGHGNTYGPATFPEHIVHTFRVWTNFR
jgi:hypothetical protein